ncbi:FxSxx-COOH system tetratricopeptide repeat protein, partial [Streptomyces sp. NPDC048269]|uniref:FxSxx-COOH system tetratricopeptide repeat protein n=1 Tax=Streptomyces sp. NPDC048269 TaxID=3155753 RepID=UPI00341B8075
MLAETLVELATAGGTAVAQTAGTDAWNAFRRAVARWFGRGDAQREQAALERLAQTATSLQAATNPADAERARISQEAFWQARIEAMLENLDAADRRQAADQLRALLTEYASQGGVSGGLAAAYNVSIHAEHSSIAAQAIGGGAHITSEAGFAQGLSGPASLDQTLGYVGAPGSVTAVGHSIAAGRIDKVNYHAAPRSPVTWPHLVGVLPRQADCFQDRATAQQLEHAADGEDAAVHAQVLTGFGGVGKSQLAARYARTLWQAGKLDLLVWVTAATRDAVVTGYAQAAVEILGADPTDPETAARGFLAWLEPKPGTMRRWLVVLDDLADPADLRNLWPAASIHGRTLVTTRRRDAALTGHGRQLVPVGLFTADEATAYLTTTLTAHGRHESPGCLADLADDLGYLPLALSQAAAYLLDVGLDCVTYRHRLADRASALTNVLPTPSGLPDDQANNVAATWSLSIECANQLPPAGLARPMLQLAAMLDPNGIPAAVLTSLPALNHLAHPQIAAPGQTHAGEITAPEAIEALRALHRLSLIDHTPSSPHRTVRVHQLLQRAIRDPLPNDQHNQLARAAADALMAAWPEIERDTALAQALRANFEILTLHAKDALYQPDAHVVLSYAGTSLGKAGQATAACQYFQQLANDTQHHLGPDHPHTLFARGNVAYWRGSAGDAAGAAAALEQVLADLERVLGPDHHNTLAARHNLASFTGKAGDVAGAVTVFEQVLADQERVLGPDHPDTLTTRNNLAYWRGEAGDAAGAVSTFEQVLADKERVLGPDHPDTLTTRKGLAYWRGKAGDAAGALTAFEQVLVDQERVLGPDHPDTLNTRNNLAYWRGKAGDADGAAAASEQLLADQERVLGPDHPDTLDTRHQLAGFRGEAGDAAGAVTAFVQVLADRERVLGPGHPDTLTTRNNLAYWRGKAGDAAGAVTAFEQLLADQERVLGPGHPDTLTTRNNLAYWRGKAGDAAGAV